MRLAGSETGKPLSSIDASFDLCATYLNVSRTSDSRSVAGDDSLVSVRTDSLRESAVSLCRLDVPGVSTPGGCASRHLPCVTSVFWQQPRTLVLAKFLGLSVAHRCYVRVRGSSSGSTIMQYHTQQQSRYQGTGI